LNIGSTVWRPSHISHRRASESGVHWPWNLNSRLLPTKTIQCSIHNESLSVITYNFQR